MLTIASPLLQWLQRLVRTAASVFNGPFSPAGLPKYSGEVMTDGDFDDGYDDDLFDSEFWADEDEVIRVTNILMNYAATLDYAGIDGIASDGDEYEMGDLMIRARNMIANGSISASNIEFAVTNAEQSETHKQAARDSFER